MWRGKRGCLNGVRGDECKEAVRKDIYAMLSSRMKIMVEVVDIHCASSSLASIFNSHHRI